MINKYYLVLLSLFLIIAVIYALARKSNNIERFSDSLEGKNILITAHTSTRQHLRLNAAECFWACQRNGLLQQTERCC